jgi:hypothetical protein
MLAYKYVGFRALGTSQWRVDYLIGHHMVGLEQVVIDEDRKLCFWFGYWHDRSSICKISWCVSIVEEVNIVSFIHLLGNYWSDPLGLGLYQTLLLRLFF